MCTEKIFVVSSIDNDQITLTNKVLIKDFQYKSSKIMF